MYKSILGRRSSISRRRRSPDIQDTYTETTNRKNYRSETKTPRQKSAATESSTSEGRRKNPTEGQTTKLPRTIKTQPSSSTLSSSKFSSREKAASRIVINGQTYEKVCLNKS